MYIGNLSNFFYKDKEWLYKQPKFSVEENKLNNIFKIGKEYYTLNSKTGKFQLIKTANLTENNKSSNFADDINSNISKKSKIPIIFSNELIKNRDLNSNYYENNSIINVRNNSFNDEKISLINKTFEEKNKINDNINIISQFKDERNLLINNKIKPKEHFSYDKNTTLTHPIRINNTENILINDNQLKESLQKNNKTNINHNNIIIKKSKVIYHKKNKELEDNKIIQNKLLSKRNLKKLIEKRQKSNCETKINTTNSNTNYSTNNINANKSLTNNNNNSFNNNKSIIKKVDVKKRSIYDIGKLDLVQRMFPNYNSLKINNDDSWYLKTIKNQLFKEKMYSNLRKQYQFYEDLNNKKDDLKMPKINVKKSILLCKREIFPARELLAHKLYFDYIKKQKQKDNDSCELEPILNIKK